MLSCRIAVLVSGGGTNLQALIDAQNEGVIRSGKIELVVSNRSDAYALERAEKANIKTAVCSNKDHATREEFTQALIEILDGENIDLVILAGFMCILTKSFTDHFSERVINVHPSLIPSFCGDGFYGLRVHQAALDYGVKVTGATVHYVNEITDGGKIIMQKAVDIMPDDTPETLQKRVMEQAEWIILPRSAELVCKKILTEKNK